MRTRELKVGDSDYHKPTEGTLMDCVKQRWQQLWFDLGCKVQTSLTHKFREFAQRRIRLLDIYALFCQVII